MDKAWIFLLIFLGTLAAAGAISVWIIQRKLRQVSRSMFGTDSLLEGLEQQEERIAETPRSVSSMTSIYLSPPGDPGAVPEREDPPDSHFPV